MTSYTTLEARLFTVMTTVIHTDNQEYIVLANNSVFYFHTKHIDIWYHFIHDYVKQGEIKLHYVFIKDMLVDIFTKILLCKAFEKFHACLGMLNYF